MVEVKLKLFGVFRIDSGISITTVRAERVADIFSEINKQIEEKRFNENRTNEEVIINFNEALVYINGERCVSKRKKLNDGDEVWLLSPSSGG